MLPNSRAWKLLCKLYGTVLREERQRQAMINAAVGYFAGASDINRARLAACQARVCCVPANRGLHNLDPLERRMMMTGSTPGTATLLDFTENPAASGLAVGGANDALAGTGEVDYWAIDALAGDVLSLHLDSVGGTTNTYVELRNSADGVLASNDNGGPNNNDFISAYTVATSGRLYVRVGAHSGSGNYTLRMERGRGLALETDTGYANGTVGGANVLPLSSAGSNLTARMAGQIMANESSTADVDVFYIGYLKGGTPVSLGLALPSVSTLAGKVQLLDSAGNAVADTDGNANDGAFTGSTVAPGNYYARVSATAGAGPDATYILSVSVSDTASPAVVGSTLPAEGSTITSLLFQFDVTVDEELRPATVVPASFELRSAGVNGLFDDGDDVIYALELRSTYARGNVVELYAPFGPLRDGKYRFSMTSAVTDVVGNALDGNNDGTGGDAFVRTFTVDLPALDDAAPSSPPSDETMANATQLTLAADPATPTLLSARGIGYILPANSQDWWSDQDWWKFEAQAGDKIAIRVDSPGSDLDPNVELYNPSGGHVASSNDEGPDNDSYISYYTAPTTGTYFLRVGKYYWSTVSDTYRVNVDVARGTDLESDANYDNAALGSADPVTLTQSGQDRVGKVAGLIMGPQGGTNDLDSFALGLLTGGQSVELTLRKPASSPLAAVIRVVDSAGNVLADQDGNPNDLHFLAAITTDGQYYAQVLATAGAGPASTYVLDMSVGDQISPTVSGVTGLPLPNPSETLYQQGVLAGSPLAFYKFGESSGATVVDASGNGRDGAYVGTPVLGATSVYGPGRDTSVYFDGTTSATSDSAALNLRRTVSFSFWINVDRFTNTWSPLVYKGNGSGNGRQYALWMHSNGRLYLGTSDGSEQGVETAGGAIKAGQWQHVAAVVDRDSGAVRIYVDGALAASAAIRTNDSVAVTASPLMIGQTSESNSGYSKPAARIDDLAIYGSALSEAALLAPYRAARLKGDITSTGQMPASWSATFSEKLAGTAQSQGETFVQYGGHYYTSISARTWADAQAWAAARGGRIVVVDDAAENTWLRDTFMGAIGRFWINGTDAGTEGTWLTSDGSPVPYLNWAPSQPDNSSNEDYLEMLDSTGRFNDRQAGSSIPAVIEWDAGDTDGDGRPNGYDAMPTDPQNGYDLREAGPDNTFDTPDDVVYQVWADYDGNQTVSFRLLNGPMAPGGYYRFRVTPSVTDLVGNALDGNKDGTGGDPYDLFFRTDDVPPGVVYEGQNNDTLATATPLVIVQDGTTPELWKTAQPGFGSIDPSFYQNWWGENDWWSFTVNAGDVIYLRTVVPAGSVLDPNVGLYNSAGSELTTNNSSGPDAEDYLRYTATYTGTYYARVGKYYWSTATGSYYLHVDLVRGAQAETDYDYSNSSLNNANVVALAGTGAQRTATVVGQIARNEGATADSDLFNLGALTAGNTVELTVRLPAGSTLVPIVRLLDSTGAVVTDSDGVAADGHFKVTLGAGGTYYAQVYAASGAGINAHYVLDIKTADEIPPQVIGVTQLPAQSPSDGQYAGAITATSPLAFWRFGEASGATVADDATANGLDGVYNGTVTLGAAGVYGPTHDTSMELTGAGHVTVAASPQLDMKRAVSFNFWINVDHFTNTWSALIYKGGSSGGRQFSLWLNSNGSLWIGTSDASGEQSVQTGAGVMRVGAWQHVAGVFDRDSGKMRLYVDGSAVVNASIRTGDALASATTPLMIGNTSEVNGAYSRPAARFDDFALYGSAVDEATLLRPYRVASGKGDVNSTAQLPATWQATFSEKLSSAAQSQGETFFQYNGHYYTSISARTWADAQAWAAARGGRVVLINDAAENTWVRDTFFASVGRFWINGTDEATEGTWLTSDGTAVPYLNWLSGQPDNSSNEDYLEMIDSSGRHNDRTASSSIPAVIEWDTADTDGDGKPDGYDVLPNDAQNGYELRGAGANGTFDDSDDVLWPVWADFDGNQTVSFTVQGGPLSPGLYRFTIKAGITDVAGNALDGSGDGVGGDAYTQTFRVLDIPAGVVYEGQNNDTLATATPLVMVQDGTTPELWKTAQPGFGSIDPAFYQNWWGENDWWSFTANAGDRINLRTVVPAGSALDPNVGLYNSGGTELTSNNSSGPDAEDYLTYTATYTGTYYARVGKYYWSTVTGNYLLHIDLVRGAQAETDYDYSNSSLNNANAITLAGGAGQSRTGTVVGQIMRNEGATADSDLYNLGALQAGNTVQLSVRLPAGSTLSPMVRLLDWTGNVVVDGNATNGVFSASVAAGGTYYAQVYALSGAGVNAHYVLDVSVTDSTPPRITNVTRLPSQLPSETEYVDGVSGTNPLAFWRFGEASGATTAVDASASGINATYNGTYALGATGAYGPGHGTSLGVNGAGHVSVSSAQLDLTRAVSFSFWMNVNNYTNTWTPLVYKGGTNSAQRTYALWMKNDGMLHFATNDGSGQQEANSATGTVRLGTWQHVAGVIDRDAGTMRLYVDGNLVATTAIRTNNSVSNPSTPLLIGWTTESDGSYSKLSGRIDDFALYGRSVAEQDLLRGYVQARGAGDSLTTDQLVSTFQLTTSEKLRPETVNSQSFDVGTYGGHAYVKISGMTWEAAQAWAAARGGHLVVPNDAAEETFITTRFGSSQFWIGLTDRTVEGTWTLHDGSAPAYTHWRTGEPNSGANSDYGYQATDGLWYDGGNSSTMDALVEFASDADTDGDGMPDAVDARPTDAFNGFDLRSDGGDGIFGNANDVVYQVWATYDGANTIDVTALNGPLAAGKYRLTVTTSLKDVVGNALDGNGDGTGGDVFVQYFEVNPIPTGVTFEGPNNDDRTTALSLTLAQDPAGSGYYVARVRGSIDPAQSANWWGENDWYAIQLQAGDRLSLSVDSTDGALNPYLGLYNSAGSELTTDDDGGPGANSFISNYSITTGGIYYVRIGKYYWHATPGNYDLRVDVGRGITLEADREYANNSTSGATAITYNVNGAQKTATAAGTIMAGQSGTLDQDYYDLGVIDAGQTVLLSVRLPSSSLLKPIVEIRNANNQVVSIATNPAAAVARADVSTSGRYYALVIGTQGQGVYGQYLLDVAVQPTSSLDFADLTVSVVQPVANAQSGELVTVNWTVGNYGAITTPGSSWSDRVVLSANNVYGDADDVQLGVFTHTGALTVNQTYDASAQVRLPLGISGSYYMYVATDSANSVAEFIFEANNSTATLAPFTVTQTPFADLVVTGITPPTRIVANEPFTVTWTVQNTGTGTTGNGQPGGTVSAWVDRIILSANDILGDADDRVIADVARTGELAGGGQYGGTFTGMLPAGLTLPAGDYRLFVVADATEQVYEGPAAGSNGLLGGVVEVVPSRYVDLDPTVVTVSQNPATSGNSLGVTYTVANNGIAPTGGTWSDKIYLSLDGTLDGTDTLLGTYTRNDVVAAGGSYTKTETVTLPERIDGTYHVIVVADSGTQLFEYKYETNNEQASAGFAVVRRAEADLSVAPTTTPAEATRGQQVSLSWTVSNTGPGATRSAFVDRVYLSSDATWDASDTQLASVSGEALAALTGTYTRTTNVTISSNIAPGTWYLIFRTDATNLELEGDENNNFASAAITVRAADLKVESVTPATTSVSWGASFNLDWVVKNIGDGATVSNWSDAVYLSTDATWDAGDRSLGSFAAPAPLAAGAQYPMSKSLQTNLSWGLPDGTYYLLVRSDVFGQQTETGEANNILASGPMTFSLPSLPDLGVDPASIQLAAAGAKSGDTVTLNWTERNTGNAAVGAASYTRVRVTRASDGSTVYDSVRYFSAADNAGLTSGGTAARSVAIALPNGPAGAGTFNVEITADNYSQVFEHNAGGTAETNNVGTGSFSSTLAAYPDLSVTGLAVTPSAPKSGQSITINYALNNGGNGAVAQPFYYSIQVTHVGTGQSLYSRVEYYDTNSVGAIGAGQSVPRSATFTLPDGTLGSGQIQVTVRADHYNGVFEYNAGGTAETNNEAQLSFTSTLAEYPDLQVSNVAVSSGTLTPGEQVLVTWTLTNTGNKSVSGPLSEKVFLSSDNTAGGDDFLRTVTFDGTLAAGASISRSAVITVPAFVAGQRWLVVQTDSASQVYEQDETNNTSVSATAVSVPLGLAMTAGVTQVGEGAQPFNVTISRNGSTAGAVVVNLANTRPDSMQIPATVTIPAGSASVTFLVSPINNTNVDGSRLGTISATAQGGGYGGASIDLTVTDDDAPALTVQLSPNPISEGEGAGSLRVRVYRNTATTNALTVYLTSDDPLRATVPSSAIIPAGAAYVDVFGDIKDNVYIDGARSIGVVASATGFAAGSNVTLFLDNDIPNLTLTAEQTTLSEAAGTYGTTATVTRNSPSPIDVYVQLTGGNGNLVLPTFVKIPAFQTSASFSIGTINNSDVSADRTLVISARVVDSFTKTPMESGKADLSIRVTEDDGPVLTVTTTTPAIREDGTGTIRVRRNTGTTGNLTVALVSSDTTELTVPASVIIPNGVDFVDVTVTGVQDSVIDGAVNATVSASAIGYGGGSAVITVTDGDLADLAVTNITVPASGETGQTVNVSYTVRNQGVADATGTWTDRIYISDRPVIDDRAVQIRQYIRSTALGIGGEYSQSFPVSLPSGVGPAYIIVQTDYVGSVTELREGNNTVASSTINVAPAYTATVQANKDVYGAGQPVLLTGVATKTSNGAPAAFEFVKIYVMVNGTTRTLSAFTAADGTYQATFQPLSTEAGNYQVAAAHPGIQTYSVQDTFAIAGMSGGSDSLTLTPDFVVTRTGQLVNRSSVPITGIQYQVLNLPDGLQLTVNVPSNLPGGGTVPLIYSLLATKADIGRGTVTIRLTSDQGATVDVPVTVDVVPLTASLVTNPGTINEGMIRGERKIIQFSIRNTGSAPSGAVSIALPAFPWMRLVSPSMLPSIDPGGSATVSLELNPAADLPLEMYTGQIAINAAGGASRGLGFSIRALSVAQGDVKISVVDEYTFYVEGNPKVAGATVRLYDPFTGAVVAGGQAGANGIATFTNVPEGAYQLEVFAPEHGTFRSRFDVNPGVTNEKEVFIQRQLVTYSWTVVPVDIQDTYKITLQPTFQTNVPVPVVTVEEPLVMPLVVEDEWTQFNITLTNHGLIAAKGLKVNLPQSPYFELRTLVADIGDLPAKTTIQVPVQIRGKVGLNDAQKAIVDAENAIRNSGLLGANQAVNVNCLEIGPDIPCLPKLNIDTVYYFECGPDNKYTAVPVSVEPVCVAKDIYECLKQAWGTAAESLPSLGGNLANAPCALIDLILQCADTGLSDCQKALIKAACQGITGALTGGLAGAAAGVGGAAGDLLSCLCDLLNFDLNPGSSTPTGDGGWGGGGWGGGYLNPYGGGSGGSFSTSGCSPASGSSSTGGSPVLLAPNADGSGVCATVTLQIEQSAVLTRTGFAGTFTLKNGTPTNTLSGIRVDIDIRDSNGNSAVHKFGFREPDVTGMGDVAGTGVLAGGQTGSARYLFVPTRDAAPTAAQTYHIGGTLRYIDNGIEVSVPLIPATITVHPDPLLTLDYFLQRDVFSDDPFTDPVEASEPFSLGVIVNNSGAGTARNFNITSGQPRIIENEKGLLIDFEIIGTQVKGNNVSPSLTANFGDIFAGTSQSARWMMTSTLQGHFIDFKASFEHVDDFGNPRTSLIDGVNFHELDHALRISLPGKGFADDGQVDFLANDVADPSKLPDRIYYSGGGSAAVLSYLDATTDGPVTNSDLTVQLTAPTVGANGWSYLRLANPGPGFVLKDVIRADGSHLKVGDHAWTTNRTFGAEGKVTYVDRLHILDFEATGTYTLVYAKADEVAPTITAVGPVAPNPRNTAVNAVTVTFSEKLAAGAFDMSDVSLTLNGAPVDLSGASIVQLDDTHYSINGLSLVTGTAGTYALSVNAAGIRDLWDNVGSGTQSHTWQTVPDVPVINSLGAGIASITNTPVGQVLVSFSKPIDATSFGLEDITFSRNGSAITLSSPVVITQLSPSDYRIDALAGFGGLEGEYTLSVNAAGVTDLSANAGAGMANVAWTIDTTAPTITFVESLATNPRNIAVLDLDVEFSEPVDASTLTAADISLKLNGGPDLFNNGLTFTQLTPTKLRLSGFTSYTGGQGTYVFTVLGAGIADASGNAVSNDMSTTWVMDTAAPAAPTNLAITPDNGASSTDGRTNTLSITLTGNLPEAGSTARVVDLTTNTILGAGVTNGSTFTKQITFAAAGAHHLRVYAVDGAGNVSADAFFDVFVDLAKPTVTSVTGFGASTISVPVNELTVTFSKAITASSFGIGDVTVTRDGSPVSLSGASIVQVDATNFKITGLTSATTPLGTYVLTVDATTISDDAGNSGSAPYAVTWNHVSSLASIGDQVFVDANFNGMFDTTEVGAANVTVRLYAEGGTLVATTTTDALGNYAFNDLDADGRFFVEFVAPAGYGLTHANVANDLSDSDPDIVTGRTEVFDVGIGANTQWDAGIVQLGSIAGKAYNDANNNHQQDASEGGLGGFTVFLDLDRNNQRDAAEPTTQTLADGSYSFGGLRPGTYVVAMEIPTGWQQTTPDATGIVVTLQSANIVATNVSLTATPETPTNGFSSAQDLIGLDELAADSRFDHLDGSGYTVVIIDTGIDLGNSFFGPDVDNDGIADRIVFQHDFGSGDDHAQDETGHGTHIAGIIGSSDSTYRGVASGVNFVVFKIFDDGGHAIFHQAEQALQWVTNNATLYNIVAVNMSFGDGRNWDWPSATDCGCGNTVKRESYGLADELATLRSMNVLSIAAAGNNFYEVAGVQGMNYPAADPATISVGAVWDSDRGGSWAFNGTGAVDFSTGPDRIAAFSQRQGGYLDVFAPGAIITSAKVGGGVTTMQGTSQATAFVTGAAVLAQQLAMEHLGRKLTLAEFRSLINSTGKTILDGDDENDNVNNSGQAYVRLDMYAMANAIMAMNPAAAPNNGGGTTENPGSHDTSGQGHAYQIALAPGQNFTGANFGIRSAQAPQLELGNNPLQDKVVAGYTFQRDVPFLDADLFDGWTVTIDYGDGSTPVTTNAATRMLSLDHLYAHKGLYTITVTITDDRGLSATDTMAFRVLPAVTGITVNDGAAQRSTVNRIAVDFADAFLPADSLPTLLMSRRDGAPANLPAYTMTRDPANASRLIIDFGNESLADGVWDMGFMAVGFSTSFASANGSAVNFAFHRLFGDLDGDRDVDGQDLAAFRPVLNTSWAGFNAAKDGFDGNQDNAVTRADYDAARLNSGTVLTYSSADYTPAPTMAAEAPHDEAEELVSANVPMPTPVEVTAPVAPATPTEPTVTPVVETAPVTEVTPAPVVVVLTPAPTQTPAPVLQTPAPVVAPVPVAKPAPVEMPAPVTPVVAPVLNIVTAPAPVATPTPTLVAAEGPVVVKTTAPAPNKTPVKTKPSAGGKVTAAPSKTPQKVNGKPTTTKGGAVVAKPKVKKVVAPAKGTAAGKKAVNKALAFSSTRIAERVAAGQAVDSGVLEMRAKKPALTAAR